MSLYLGIDIAKRRHVALLLDDRGAITTKAFKVDNNRAGFDGLLDRLAGLDQPVMIALEATGHYWLALYDQLTGAGYTVHVLNPLQVHAYRRSGIRKSKTDRIDAFWIADYLRIGALHSTPQPVDTYLQLRQLSRFHSSLTSQIDDIKRRILAVLDRIFPEYETLFSDVFIATSRRLLAEAVTPEDFATFDLHELADIIRRTSHGRLGLAKAQELQALARRSIGVTFLMDAAQLELNCLLAQLDFLEAQVNDVATALAELVAALPHQFLTTIPGIGPASAATLLAEIGDVNRFPALENLVAYAGIVPAVYESGQFQARQAHMPKRGSPHLRRALWLAAHLARLHDPELRAYYDKRRAEGKPYGVVMGAICHKLLARIFVILREQRPYIVRSP